MKCPKCASIGSSVIDSRGDETLIRRRRVCDSCEFRFTTFERIEPTFPMVIKKDGRRESYDGAKVRGGIVRACEKRPISVEMIDRMVDSVERSICDLCVKEVPSIKIGDFVMDALKEIDKIAYIRFASVYREFSDVNQFVDALKSLDENGVRKRAAKVAGV